MGDVATAASAQHDVMRTWDTAKAMLTDRGLNIRSLSDITNEDILARSKEQSVFTIDAPSCGLRIVYNLNPKFRTADMKKTMTAPPEITHALFVLRDKPTISSQMASVRDASVSTIKTFEMFTVRELRINITRHCLVSECHILTPEEEADFVKHYSIKNRAKEIPIILTTDPVARYYALKPGQIVRVVRPSPSAGTYYTYLCCQRAV